jgi:tetrahydromethanopterin S-methyltransferase subunit F
MEMKQLLMSTSAAVAACGWYCGFIFAVQMMGRVCLVTVPYN